MKLITVSKLFVLLLCCCYFLTVNAECWIECPESQINLPELQCLLKDDGNSTSCTKHITESDLAGHSTSNYSRVALSLKLNSTIKLQIFNAVRYANLKVGAFRLHPKITELTIYHRQTYIRPDLLHLLPHLKYLNLYNVKFRYFPYFQYSSPALTYLRINSPSFFPGFDNILRKGHLSDLPKLKDLYLNFKQFFITTDDTFSGLTALKSLYIVRVHCHNTVVTFSPLVSLTKLRFERSGLTDISFLKRTTILYRLTSLSLGNNLITSLQCEIFSNYTNLQWLNLNSNKISRLENGCFSRLNALHFLHLSNNQLREINIATFTKSKSLHLITLSGNVIPHLSSRMFEYLSPSFKYLHLLDVPLHCDCGLKWMSIVNLNIYYSRCSTPSQHSGKAATDPSIYVNCTQELSYQCFNRTNSCPTGSHCQDTLDSYTCVCEEENYHFVKHLDKCVSSNRIGCLETSSRS